MMKQPDQLFSAHTAEIMFKFSSFLFVSSFFITQSATEAVQVAPIVLTGETAETCPSQETLNVSKAALKQDIANILQEEFATETVRNCPCGGTGNWTRIAHLNMSDPSQQCLANQGLVTTPVRGCGRPGLSRGCYSTVFPSHGQSYSRVCGKILAYQRGTVNGFEGGNIEYGYIDGIALTHGPPGSRQHIWSFVAAWNDGSRNCPCQDPPYTGTIPSFIENNYFCASGAISDAGFGFVYKDDPLWDGEGCRPPSTCCEFNNPPWFCTTLPQPTTDDLEIRNCGDDPPNDEDTIVSFIDIYVM